MTSKTYFVKNMHCNSCAAVIELDLEDIGISAKCSFAKQTLEVEGEHEENTIKEVVKKAGYELVTS